MENTEPGPDIVSRTLTRELTIDLTQEDTANLGKQAAEIKKQITLEEIDFDKVRTAHKAKVKDLEADMRSILSKIRDGKRNEVVECTEIRNYSEGKVSYFLGGKLVEERTMEGDELQKDLFARKNALDTPSDAELELKGQELLDEAKPTDVRDVIRQETSVHTKHSSLDGPTL